ncbi:MAG TPA: hypothetical protein VJ694_01900, partial [Patescibacteria group bacterium]|nr:hypothetical protein [Patescibacteria group bacterium]
MKNFAKNLKLTFDWARATLAGFARRKTAKQSTLVSLAILIALYSSFYPTGRVNAASCTLQGNTISVS